MSTRYWCHYVVSHTHVRHCLTTMAVHWMDGDETIKVLSPNLVILYPDMNILPSQPSTRVVVLLRGVQGWRKDGLRRIDGNRVPAVQQPLQR